MEDKSRIIIFGTGKYGKEAYNYFGSENIIFFIDNNSNLNGEIILGKHVYLPEVLRELEGDYIIILAAREDLCIQMEYQLLKMGVDKFLYYEFIKRYISENKMEFADFIEKSNEDATIYKLMYKQELNKEKQCLEKIEFFQRYSDIRTLKPATGKMRERQERCLELLVKLNEIIEKLKLNIILEGGNLLGAIRNGGFIPWDDDMDVDMMRNDYDKLIKYFYSKGLLLVSNAKYGDYYSWNYELTELLRKNKGNIVLSLNGMFLNAYMLNEKEEVASLDIFPLDYYRTDCQYSDVLNYIAKEEKNITSQKTFRDYVKYNCKLTNENPYTSRKKTMRIGYGIEVFFCLKSCKDFFKYEDIFPLVKRSFENYEINTPHNSENCLRVLYGDFYQWPEDAGVSTHGLNRHYLTYSQEENVVYIDGLMTHDFYATLTDKKIIVEKYKIKNSSDYFKIIEELEKRGIQYYVYA